MSEYDPIPAEVGDPVPALLPKKVTVLASCGAKDGAWHCLNHKETFRHNFDKDSHISHGKHRLAWVCLEHGPEVP